MSDLIVKLREAGDHAPFEPSLYHEAADEIERLRKAISDMGWQLNPDRMGGQFTEEEIKRATEWL